MRDKATAQGLGNPSSVPLTGADLPIVPPPNNGVPWLALFKLMACLAFSAASFDRFGFDKGLLLVAGSMFFWIFVVRVIRALAEVSVWLGDSNASKSASSAKKSLDRHRKSNTWYKRADGMHALQDKLEELYRMITEFWKGKL